jgi:hypothetical protein
MSETKKKLNEAKALFCRVNQCSKPLQVNGYHENGKPFYFKTCVRHHAGHLFKLS